MPSTQIYTLSLHDALPISYYFRHSFVVSNLARITNLTLHVRRDDGIVVYLNGTNVFRNNLPQTYTASTPASSSVEATNYLTASDRKSTRLNSSHSQISYAVHPDLHSFPTRRSSDLLLLSALLCGLESGSHYESNSARAPG